MRGKFYTIFKWENDDNFKIVPEITYYKRVLNEYHENVMFVQLKLAFETSLQVSVVIITRYAPITSMIDTLNKVSRVNCQIKLDWQ